MAIAYRSYFAFVNAPLVNSRGEDTGAVFGFANTLFKILREYKPEYLAVVFDTSAPTFRHALHAEYKATREKMPEPLAAQLPRIRQLAGALRLPVLEQPGYEADDLIGTLAVHAAAAGLEVTVVSGDKDFMQLVRPGIGLLNPGRGSAEYEPVAEAEVQAKFGVGPEQVIEVLGLMGDASDNVPGVPGIGAKTATRLIQEWGTVEAVLAQAPGFKQQKLRESLVAYADQARLSRELVTIRTDAPVALELPVLAVREWDQPALAALLRELEFGRLLEQLQLETGTEPAAPEQPRATYELVTGLARVEELATELRTRGAFSFDLETTSLDPREARIVGIALAWAPGEAAYLPVGHTRGPNLDLQQVLSHLGPLLEEPGIAKWGQNLKYDTSVLALHGLETRGVAFDAMVADYLLDPGDRAHNLETLAQTHLGYRMQPIEELIGMGKEQRSFAEVDQDQACFYAGEDADVALRLAELLRPRLQEAELTEVFDRVEMPLVTVLRDMELAGVAVDVAFLEEFSGVLTGNLEQLRVRIYELAGQEFNLNSTQQLAQVLFEGIGLRPRRKTKTGYSTDVNVLEELAQEHPLPALLLDYRELTKLQSTYVDALPTMVHPRTGRIHASFNQTVAATGRLSVSDPNLQNIPIRTPLGREVRKAFVPGREGAVLLSADYSQIELRLLAHLSGDEQLCEAFQAGEDIHARTASLVFNLMPQFITPQMRSQAKTVNFAVIYGQTPFGLSRQLGIPLARAREFIESYFSIYARVRAYIDATVAQARQDGYVKTLLGRRRYLPEINSRNASRREFAERTAINSPIQGSQADMIKLAMIAIREELRRRGLSATMILQVHDELLFEVAESDLAETRELVEREMAEALPLKVPVVVESGYGRSWFEAH
jgi:DNA polymerase-1